MITKSRSRTRSRTFSQPRRRSEPPKTSCRILSTNTIPGWTLWIKAFTPHKEAFKTTSTPLRNRKTKSNSTTSKSNHCSPATQIHNCKLPWLNWRAKYSLTRLRSRSKEPSTPQKLLSWPKLETMLNKNFNRLNKTRNKRKMITISRWLSNRKPSKFWRRKLTRERSPLPTSPIPTISPIRTLLSLRILLPLTLIRVKARWLNTNKHFNRKTP